MKCFQAEVMNESVYMRIKHSREQAGRKRQNTGMIKGVIFDMDGTMFDTGAIIQLLLEENRRESWN